jgi:hypothetical protein
MHRILFALVLTCASLNAQWLFDPIRNGLGRGITAIGNVITPDRAHWEPDFEPQAKIVPPYKLDGSLNDGSYFTLVRKREFATDATAHWLAKEFNGQAVLGPYAGSDSAVMRLNPPRRQWSVVIDGVLIPAGHIAWWYTLRPAAAAEGDQEAGYWPWFAADDTRMNGAKSLAKMFVDNSVKYGVSRAWDIMLAKLKRPKPPAPDQDHGPTLPPNPFEPCCDVRKAA